MSSSRSLAAPLRAVFLAAVLAAVALPSAQADEPEKHPYVVIIDRGNAKKVANDHSRRFGVSVKKIFERIGGYAGEMTDDDAKKLAKEPGVVIAPDTVMTAFAAPSPQTLSGNYNWGLDRINAKATPPLFDSTYYYGKTGAGVTAYVIDTGVKVSHTEFGNRAVAGKDALGTNLAGTDCNGHGTHVAGIIGGSTYGVAKDVNIVSVRVLNCAGSGTTSQIVAGVDWVTTDHATNRKGPAVANMSLGGATNAALDAAVKKSITQGTGITYAIAAGNGNILGNGVDACQTSPARVAEALTVAATDRSDNRATWSNYGTCVDVYAPGADIISAWGAGTTNSDWRSLSGTSMAAPHVAGVAALLLQMVGGASPAQVSESVRQLATASVVKGTNTTGAKLLRAPWEDTEINYLTTNSASPLNATPPPTTQPPPPRNCFIICFG